VRVQPIPDEPQLTDARTGAGQPAASGAGFEMEFRLVRRDGAWRIVSKSTIAGLDDVR
jgi:hypothetical protein